MWNERPCLQGSNKHSEESVKFILGILVQLEKLVYVL